MGQVGRNLVKKIPGRNNLFVILLLIFTFLINSSFSLFENSYEPTWAPLVLSKSKLLFIGTFLLAIVILSAIIILFSVKLRLRHVNGKYIYLAARSVAVKDNKEEILGALTIKTLLFRQVVIPALSSL